MVPSLPSFYYRNSWHGRERGWERVRGRLTAKEKERGTRISDRGKYGPVMGQREIEHCR